MATKTKHKPKLKVPKYVLIAQVFGPIYGIIKDIEQGEVNIVENESPVVVIRLNKSFKRYRNNLFSVSDYLISWCDAWQRIGTETKNDISVIALRKLAENIKVFQENEDFQFDSSELSEAKKELDVQKSLWYNLPPKALTEALRDAGEDLEAKTGSIF